LSEKRLTAPVQSLPGSEGLRSDSPNCLDACRPGGYAPGPPSADEVLATTAHELRLPLSHIKGFVSSLRRTDVNWDEETRREFIAEIDVETDRLAELIDSLLSGRASNTTCTPAVDLAFSSPSCVVQRAIHRVRGLVGDRPLRLELAPCLPSVRMDASQMERVLANLLQNAIKYSPPGTPLGVSARITDDDELELSVDDEGPGIPLEHRERIFSPFFRAQTAERSKVPGYGLGLAICRSIVLAHGGRMLVGDRPGGGTRFSVLIPAQTEAGYFDITDKWKDRGNDPAIYPGRRRRGANAQAPLQQSQGNRLHGTHGSRWDRSHEADGRAHVRPAVA
jgi:signal transduction histidine kinase